MKYLLIGIGTILGLLFLVNLVGFRTVDAGEVGVVTRFGAVTGKTLGPGANFITPFVDGVRYINTKYLLYETMKTEDQKNSKSDYKDGAVDTNTEDGQAVWVYYTIRFSIDPTRAVWVVEKFGSEEALVDKIVRAESRSWARVVPSEFSAEELYVGSGREKVAQMIFEKLKDKFTENGITIDSFLVRELDFKREYTAAIESKQIAAVQVETEKNKAEQAKFQKEAAITAAEAQAKAQDLQRQTISPELLQLKWIEKWSGAIPQVVTGENATMFINPFGMK